MLTGATNSGKTSLLRALLSVLPLNERLIVVELSQELCLWKHPDLHANVVEMGGDATRPGGKGGLSMAQLVRRTLRLNRPASSSVRSLAKRSSRCSMP